MAKIRTLKGEFFRNADISRGGLVAKVLAAGQICAVADDDGRFKAQADYLKGEIFTHDEVSVEDIEKALQHLVDVGFSRVYRLHGRAFGVVASWKTHQPVPPSRYVASVLPAPPNTKWRRRSSTERKQSSTTVSSRAGVGSEGNRNRSGEEGKGRDISPTAHPDAVGEQVLVLAHEVSRTPVEQVFDAWRERWHPTAKLTDQRRTKIAARLREGSPVEDLILAVTEGAAADPWEGRHTNLNDDLTHLLKNATTVEKFLGLANHTLATQPAPKAHPLDQWAAGVLAGEPHGAR